jgi:tetratricopeptide (TPR) repeat protein
MSQNQVLAAPRDAQTANPAERSVPAPGSTVRRVDQNVALVELHVGLPSSQGRKVIDPRQVEMQQYIEDEQAGLVSQAAALVAKVPLSAIAWARYTQTLISVGAVDDSISAATRTLEVAAELHMSNDDPAVNTARFIAARVLAITGNILDAENALAKLPHNGPWAVFYAALADGRGEYRQALARLGDGRSPSVRAFRGYLQLKLNDPQSALRQLRAAWREGDNSPSLLLNLAYGYALVGSLSKAVDSARQAVILLPSSRHASFNLANYLRNAGRFEDALAELRRLRSIRGESDPHVAAAIADIYLASGDIRQARRELRRAQHHNAFGAQSKEQAELAANAAILEWRLGERDRESVLEVIRTELRNVGPDLALALMLADVSYQTSVVGEIENLYCKLQERFPEHELSALKLRLLLLKGDLDAAARVAMSHLAANQLNPVAASVAVFLYGQVIGDYETASNTGIEALRRMPKDRMLVNNVAFSLTLAGRARQADDLLAGERFDDGHLLATRGLVDLGLGMVTKGLARYDQAAEFVRSTFRYEQDSAEFVQLMRNYEVLMLRHLGLAESPEIPDELRTTAVPKNWRLRPDYLVLHRVAERLKAPWVVTTGS